MLGEPFEVVLNGTEDRKQVPEEPFDHVGKDDDPTYNI